MISDKPVATNKNVLNISILVDNGFMKDVFMQAIKNTHSDDEALLMTRLFFVSESMGQNADKMIDFLADVGLIHYLDDWLYLPEHQAERISSILKQKNEEMHIGR